MSVSFQIYGRRICMQIEKPWLSKETKEVKTKMHSRYKEGSRIQGIIKDTLISVLSDDFQVENIPYLNMITPRRSLWQNQTVWQNTSCARELYTIHKWTAHFYEHILLIGLTGYLSFFQGKIQINNKIIIHWGLILKINYNCRSKDLNYQHWEICWSINYINMLLSVKKDGKPKARKQA